MRHLTCKTTKTIGLLKLISAQKVHKTYDKQGSILHYLITNQNHTTVVQQGAHLVAALVSRRG